MGYPPEMDNKYFWYILAALSVGYVLQVKRPEAMPWWKRLAHLAAGAICAVWFSPFAIKYFEMENTEGQYLIPFAIGAFWWKFFEAMETAAGSIKLPWGK